MKQPFKSFSIGTLYVWLGLLVLVPLLLTFITSFLTRDDMQLISWHLTAHNYLQLFNPLYLRILIQSFELALACTLFCLIMGYPAAFIIARNLKQSKNLCLMLLMIPFWTSSLIRTYAILALLKTKGLINSLLLHLGIIHHPLMLLYNNTAVLIGCVYNLLPFMMLPLYANIEKLDDRLIEAARDLGAKRFRLFTRIVLPLTMPGILAGSVLVFLPAMTLFYIPTLLGGAKSLLLGNLIQSQFLEMRDWPGGAATSVLLTVIMLGLVGIYRYYTRGKQREGLL